MSLEELISLYGYIAIAVGTFLKSEMILVLGGFAAHRGYLEIPWVVVSGFLGTFFGDQLYFHIGRAKGKSVLEKHSSWEAKSEKVFSLLQKHQVLLILGFRFLYGFRTITPFVLGASRVSTLSYLVLNFIGALIWATVVGYLGYVFGHAIEGIIGDIKRYELYIFSGLALLGLIIWTARFYTKRRRQGNPVNK